MNKKKISIIVIFIIVVIFVVGFVTYFIIQKNKSAKYVYTNPRGDKYTQEELLNVKINNSRIGYLENQLKNEAASNLGTITSQGEKDLHAYIPETKEDSAKDILELQEQLIGNLQQDIASN